MSKPPFLASSRPVVPSPQSGAVPGWSTLASARAGLRAATAHARNRRQPRQPKRKEAA